MAPEKYEDFKLPEGVVLEGETLKGAQDLFKSLNLPQDAAQKLVDFHAAQMKSAAATPMAEYNAMREKWRTDTRGLFNDAEMTQVKANVGKLYAAIGNEGLVNDFKEAMNLTGVGDHPAFISVLNKISEFVVEGRHVRGGQPSKFGQIAPGTDEKPSAAQAMYPNLK